MFSRAYFKIRRNISSVNRNDVVKLEKLLSNVSNCQVVNPRLVRSKGIVVLLGWGASRVKSIVKYAGIYSELGIPSVCAAPSLLEVWFPSFGGIKAKKILSGVKESSNQGCEMILHLFSGSCFNILPKIVEEVANKNNKLHLSGIVFDSGPVPFSLKHILAAANLVKQQGAYGPLTHAAACTTGTMITTIVGRKRRRSMRTMLDHPVLQVPQLYLYSSSDSVVSMNYVEDEIRLQGSRGVDITSHCWNDSEHVKHFVQHPGEYTSQINKFVHKLHFVV